MQPNRNKNTPTIQGVRMYPPKCFGEKINAMLGTYVNLGNIKTKAKDFMAQEIIKELILIKGN